MQLDCHGADRFHVEVGQPTNLIARVLDAGVGVVNEPVTFSCTTPGAFLFTKGGTMEGVVMTNSEGFAECQITALAGTDGRSFQIRARADAATGPLDQHFTVHVAANNAHPAVGGGGAGTIEIPVMVKERIVAPRIVFRRIDL